MSHRPLEWAALPDDQECPTCGEYNNEDYWRRDRALDRVEALLGTMPLTGLSEDANRAICEAWACAREKRADPKLIPMVPRPASYQERQPE